MDNNSTDPTTTSSSRSSSGVRRLIIAGLTLIVVGLVARSLIYRADWYRHRVYRNMEIDELALAIHDHPNDPLVFLYYGGALLKSDNAPAAEKNFTRAVELDPKSGKALVGLGTAMMRQNHLKPAFEVFEKATKLDDKNVEAFLGLSQVYFNAGSSKRAIDPLKRITELEPENADAWYNLGKLYGDAHLSDQALLALEKAAKLNPKRADYLRDLGQLYRHYSRLEDAEKALGKALQIDSKDPISYYWIGQVYAKMADTPKNRGKAESAFVQAIARDPKMPEAYFELGQLYERRANYQMAVSNYARAVALDPSDDRSLYHQGLCMVKAGQTSEGQKLIKSATELSEARNAIKNLESRLLADQNNPQLHLRMARLYRKYGNDNGAYSQYLIYRSLKPSDSSVVPEVASLRQELIKSGIPEDKIPTEAPRQGQ